MRRPLLPLVGLVSLLTPVPVLALLIWWWAVSAEMPGRTTVRRALFGLVTVYASIAATLTVLAVLHRRCDPRGLLAVFLVAALLWRLPRRERRPQLDFEPVDRWALSFGGLTFVLLYLPFLGASTGTTMALLSQTTDGGTHVQLVTAVQRYHGYVHLLHPRGLSADVDRYPAAWHGNVWVLANLLFGEHPTPSQLTRVVAWAAVTTYAVLATLAASLVLQNGTGLGRTARLVGLGSLGLSMLVGFGIFFLQAASYSQLVAIAVLLTLAVLAAETATNQIASLIVLAASSVALMQSWYLLAPPLAASVFVLFQSLRLNHRVKFVGTILTCLLCLYPVVTGPSASHVGVQGSTLLPTLAGLLGLLIATAVGCLYAVRLTNSPSTQVLFVTTVASLLTLAALVLDQGFVAGSGVSYYGAKVFLSTLMLGAVLASAAIASGASRLRSRHGFAAVVAVAGIGLATGSTMPDTFPTLRGHPEQRVAATTLAIVFDQPLERQPSGWTRWVADGCNRVSDRIATKWFYDTTLTWTPELSEHLLAYSLERRGDATALLAELKRPSLHRLELYVNHECDAAMIGQLVGNRKVRIIHVG